MPTRVSFTFYGEEQIARTIRRVADNLDNARPLWDELTDRFVAMEVKQFRSEGGHGSGGWAPLSPRYAAWKAGRRKGHGRKGSKRRAANEEAGRRQAGNKILVLYGDLSKSLTQRPLGFEHFTPRSMTIGSDVVYGKYHQRGGPRLPRRRPIEFRESERRTWVREIQRFVVSGRTGGKLREF